MKKDYANISRIYESANHLFRCYIKDACGMPRLILLTEADMKKYRARGVNVARSAV